MADTRRLRTIAAEPQAIWDVIADFGAISSWADIVDHSCLLTPATDGVAVGTTRRVQVGRDTLVERITEIDPPHALGYDVEGFPRRLHIKNRWTLTPTTGATLVTLTNTVEIGTNPLQRLAERIVGRVSAKQVDSMLAGLTHRMERSRARAQPTVALRRPSTADRAPQPDAFCCGPFRSSNVRLISPAATGGS